MFFNVQIIRKWCAKAAGCVCVLVPQLHHSFGLRFAFVCCCCWWWLCVGPTENMDHIPRLLAVPAQTGKPGQRTIYERTECDAATVIHGFMWRVKTCNGCSYGGDAAAAAVQCNLKTIKHRARHTLGCKVSRAHTHSARIWIIVRALVAAAVQRLVRPLVVLPRHPPHPPPSIG